MRICDYFMPTSLVGSFKPKGEEERKEKGDKVKLRVFCFVGGRKGKILMREGLRFVFHFYFSSFEVER